jgi:hypothetical protein
MRARHQSDNVRPETNPYINAVEQIVFCHDTEFTNGRGCTKSQLQVERSIIESQANNRWRCRTFGDRIGGCVRIFQLVAVDLACPICTGWRRCEVCAAQHRRRDCHCQVSGKHERVAPHGSCHACSCMDSARFGHIGEGEGTSHCAWEAHVRSAALRHWAEQTPPVRILRWLRLPNYRGDGEIAPCAVSHQQTQARGVGSLGQCPNAVTGLRESGLVSLELTWTSARFVLSVGCNL